MNENKGIPERYLDGMRQGYKDRMMQAKTGYWTLPARMTDTYRSGYLAGRQVAVDELGLSF